jgi:hypothetical protein
MPIDPMDDRPADVINLYLTTTFGPTAARLGALIASSLDSEENV